MNITFDNKKILVTGGSRGLGKAIAKAFLASGSCNVVITGRSSTQPNWINDYKNQSSQITYYKLDILNENWLQDLELVIADLGGFDICVNNAGINSIHPIMEFPREKLEQILNVNLEAPILISQMVADNMKNNSFGRIINIASVFGVVTKAHRSAYTASKSGLIGVTKTLAVEFASDGILVNSISPGFFETELTKRVLGADGIEEMTSKVPLRRLGQPEELASYVLFLASEFNNYMTGYNIVVDGGFTCE